MAAMRYVPLGRTGLDVSALAFGCMSLTPERQDEGKEALARAFELGITLYDTADVYGRGSSEQILGEALREGRLPRERVLIASKCGIVFPGMAPAYEFKAYDLSAGYLQRSCEASLQRLGVERIDLYQPHRIDYLTHPQETARALDELRAAGKIRFAGVSNHTAGEIRALAAYTRLESLQTQFSLLHQEPLEADLTATCLEHEMSVLCWSPLYRGLLARGGELDHGDWQQQREAGVYRQLEPLAQRYQASVGQLALAWLMRLPGGVVPLVGTASAAHIQAAVAAVELDLDRDDWYELMVIGRGRPMPWGQRPFHYLKDR